MKKILSSRINWLSLMVIGILCAYSCEQEDAVDKEFPSMTWGGWALQGEAAQPGGTTSVGDWYLERNYKGYVITGIAGTTEIDSVLIFKNRQLVFAGQVAKVINRDVKQQKIVYQLTNNQYYSVQFVGVDGPEDGTGNDQLLVSNFVDSREELNKAITHRYVRTNSGKRPW